MKKVEKKVVIPEVEEVATEEVAVDTEVAAAAIKKERMMNKKKAVREEEATEVAAEVTEVAITTMKKKVVNPEEATEEEVAEAEVKCNIDPRLLQLKVKSQLSLLKKTRNTNITMVT